MAARPEHLVVDAAVGLGRALRGAGLPTTVDRELAFCRALGEVDLRERAHVYWAARSSFLGRPDEVPVFDTIFARFWAGRQAPDPPAMAEHAERDPRMPGPQHGGESLPQLRTDGRSSLLLDGAPTRASQEVPSAGSEEGADRGSRDRRGLLAAYSAEEVLGDPEPLRYAEAELRAVRRLAEELRAAMPERRSRRLRPSRRNGRLDLRRTIGDALATDGEPLRPAYAAQSRRRRRLLVICDVSGSMERYSRALLGALEAVVGSGLKAETFVFATQLTRLTGVLAGRDAARALADARAAVDDWSGGTRIGPALAEFHDVYARRGFARGAITLVVSDGWDRGDPAVLAVQVRRLQLQSRRLIWVNPRPLELEGQPLAVGLRAALPFVDDYVSGVDPRAMADVSRLIAGLGPGRPARAQRPRAAAPR